MQPRTHHVLLILADISGYTDFMLANQVTLLHGQQLITNLLEAIIAEVEIPLEVKEIEGDAVFLYAVHPGDDARWQQICEQVAAKLLRFFEVFARALMASSESTVCRCGSCQNVDKLKLKIVVHSGEALFHKIDRFDDVSGVDVILVHRLLKNTVQSDEYLLLSEPARRELPFPGLHFERRSESYPGFGAIPTHVHELSAPRDEARRHFHAHSLFAVARRAVGINLRDAFAQFSAFAGSRERAERHGLRPSPLRRSATALLLALWAPFEIVLIVLLTPVRIARRRGAARQAGGSAG